MCPRRTGSSPVTRTSREPRHAIRVVEVLLFYRFYLASQVGYEHSHQKTEFSLIAQLAHFSTLTPEFIIYNHIVWPVGGIVSVCPKADALPTVDAYYYSLRAPPVVQI